jgi:hypothetical protein
MLTRTQIAAYCCVAFSYGSLYHLSYAAETCANLRECAQVAVNSAALAQATLDKANDRYNTLLKNLKNPQQRARDCDPVNCDSRPCESDELLVGGGCLVPGETPNGAGLIQNSFGTYDDRTWHCTLAPVAPDNPPLKKIRAIAWCAKIP